MPVALIIIVFAAPSVAALFITSQTASVWFGWTGIGLISIALFFMFSSILFKGLGENRTIGGTLIISFSGIAALISNFAVLYRWIGIKSPTGEISHGIWDTIYFSVVTWTTLGYGDFTPSEEARYVVVTEVIIGHLTIGLLISVFVAAIARR